jgi:RNA polymerase sigma-70 factor (ECF subfamily)
MMTLSDEELVTRCKKELPANTRSYEELVQRHMHRVYSIIFRVVPHKEDAEDITQEVFVKVYHGLKKFEQQSSFSSWLYRIATNSAFDALNKNRRLSRNIAPIKSPHFASKEEEIDLLTLQAAPEGGPEEKSIQKELRECINKVLKELDREQAHLLVLRDFDDLAYDEIARILKVGLSAVKMRIHRSRLAFQQIFNQLCRGAQPASSVAPGSGRAASKLKMGKE